MRYSDESYNLRIELDTKHFELSPPEAELLQSSLSPLRKLTEPFPVSDLYITIAREPRSSEHEVKTALVLTGKTLFSRDADITWHPALERCVDNLVQQVTAYKEALSHHEELHKHRLGTYQEVVPSQELDLERLESAVQRGDYAEFRHALDLYEESLRRRVGRWVGRYPEVQAKIGSELAIADLVEAVCLNAFENYSHWSRSVRFGDWLEHLIDASIKGLLQHPEQELENIAFARTLRELAQEQPPQAE